MKKKKYEDDDGRVISSMNVEGMPWYDKSKKNNKNNENLPDDKKPYSEQPLTKHETFKMILGAYAAILPIVLVFLAVIALVILFCVYVWFR